MRLERLQAALAESFPPNTVERPILLPYQAAYRSKAGGAPAPFFFEGRTWLWAIPVCLLALFARAVVGKGRHRRFGLFLYLTAGLVSLSLELVSFYLYQVSAGSLYAELAALIGAFMLGLAVGTYFAYRVRSTRLAWPALVMLLLATLFFIHTCLQVDPRVLLLYHLCFQFTVALATGTLFVAATSRYYPAGLTANRGAGYAAELTGSAIGALLTVTILLPVLGLQWLLLSICGVVVLAAAGLLFVSSKAD
jgi:hypothetical protein